MKQKYFKSLLMGMSIIMLASSCTNNEVVETNQTGKVAVKISAGLTSRATDNIWQANDKIGIAMLDKTSKEVINPYTNCSYITKDGSSNFAPSAAEQIMYFPTNGSEVTFKSYYPYSQNVSTDRYLLATDLSDQTSLTDIDIMTAEHKEGTSKDNPNVLLHFYHRLSKLILNVKSGDTEIDLAGCKFEIEGVKTKGNYDIINETLNIDPTSTKAVEVPLHSLSGKAIVMPRSAGEGVVFKVTTKEGGVYNAKLASDVKFDAGYKYTINITLKKAPVEVSATIEEWKEGPEYSTEVIRVVTGLNDSKGFKTGNTLDLYLKDQDGFAKTSTFTFNESTGKWSTTTTKYWEDIVANPASFKGVSVINEKLNNTQMDDILLSDVTEVNQYTGVNLTMKHAGAKAEVVLKSTDGTFSQEDLTGAEVKFPGYKNAGHINEKGEFVIDTTTGDILPKDGIAIFPPQSIKPGDIIATVTLNGRTYDVKATTENFDFEAGVAKKITLDMKKAEVEVSTVVKDWSEETIEFNDVRIGKSTLKNNSGDLQNGDILKLYTGNSTNRTELAGNFVYNETTDTWSYSNPSSPLYWEDIVKDGSIYASIVRPSSSTNSGDNQIADYIIAKPIVNNGGTDNTALNFEFQHQVAKTIVILKSDTYTKEELAGATVSLPSYTIGATMNKGVFVSGTSTGDIKLPNIANVNGVVTDYTYLQAQTIKAGNKVITIKLNDRVYNGVRTEDVVFEKGKVTTIVVRLEKSEVKVSTTVGAWTDKPAINMEGLFFTAANIASNGFNNNDKMTFQKLDSSNKSTSVSNTGTYSDGNITTSSPWYRDDFAAGDKIFAISPNVTIPSGVTSINKTLTGASNAANDIKTAVVTVGTSGNVAFDFKHAMSKITLNIFAGEGFTSGEINSGNFTAQLNNFLISGNIDLSNGKATASGAASSFSPTAIEAQTVDGNKAVFSYQSIVYPQTITKGKKLATITLNGVEYEVKFITEDKTFGPGENVVINVTLKKTGLLLTSSLTDWTTTKGGSTVID